LGKKGRSNRRWIAGRKRCVLVNQWGRVVAWDDATATVRDSAFHPLIARYDGRTIVLVDGNFHRKAGDPANLKVCTRGTWPQRILVETVFSLLTRVCHLKRAGHRLWAGLQMHLAFAVAVFKLLADWEGPREDDQGRTHLALAEFAL
jgi:hypothetical protein